MSIKNLRFPYLVSVLALLLTGLPGFLNQNQPPSLALQQHALSPKILALGAEASPDAAGGGQGTLSISAADFRPSVPTNSYENHGRFLIHYEGTAAYGYYYAPLLLPQGATITRFSLSFRDNSSSDLTANLYRDDSDGMISSMVLLDSSGNYSSPWYGSKVATTLQYAVIDNANYGYYVSLQMPKSTPGATGPFVWFTGLSIEFRYPSTTVDPSYYSMPVAGFTPFQDGYTYLNTGRFLYHNSGPGGETTNNGWYYARVQLPAGAYITSLGVYYSINSSYPGVVRLQRTTLGNGDFSNVAVLNIPAGTQGDDYLSTTSISPPLVDNHDFAYWISLDIPPIDRGNSLIIPFYVVIGYTNLAPSSSRAPDSITSGSIVPVSIPAAAFTPYEDGYDYQNDARYLSHFHDPLGGGNRGWYLAPVQLPQGAQVTGATFYWHDQYALFLAFARLQRTDLAGNFDEMAMMTSNGTFTIGFFGKTSTTSITNPIIDNRNHTYWVVWDLPVTSKADVRGCGMVLTYSFLVYIPSIRK